MPIVDEIPGEATFTMRVTTSRDQLMATAEQQARRAGELLRAGGPGFLMLPLSDGDPVEIEVGVAAEYEPSSVHPELHAGLRPCGPVVRFEQSDGAPEWLADNGFDSAGQPWMTLPDREVVWPVRPVRDTDTFVGRHGPRRDLDRAREEIQEGRETVHNVLDMIRDGSTHWNVLSGLHSEAMAVARFTQLVTPGDPEVVRYLRLAARAEIADKVRRTATELTVDLDGPVPLVTGTSATMGTAFVDAVMTAVALADPVALGLLRELSLDAFQPPEFVALQAQAMLAVATNAPDATDRLTAVLRHAETAAGFADVGPWYAHMAVPVWRLALGQAGAHEALVAHRRWWGTSRPNPGDRQDRSPEGYLSLGVLCFGDGSVRSEYLPDL